MDGGVNQAGMSLAQTRMEHMGKVNWTVLASVIIGGGFFAGCGESATTASNPSSGGDSATTSDVGAGGSGGAGNTPDAGSTNADTSSARPDDNWGGQDSGGWPDAEPNFADGSSAPQADAATDDAATGGNTNVAFGGEQDFGYFRRLLEDGQVPRVGDFSASGFFGEHFLPLPTPDCGERVCLQAMSAVMANLMDGAGCSMLRLGLNSPIVVDPDNRPPLSLAVVVDLSGSMEAGGKLDFVQQGLDILIDEMRDGDEIAIITYSTNANVVFGLAPVATNRSALRNIVRDMRATGNTNLHAGLEAGYTELLDNYDSGRQQRVILLSDGQPTQGVTDMDQILSMSAAYNSEGIGLTTVGLGTEFNIALMRDLSLRGDGNFYFLENSGAVSEVFTEELAYFTVPVAYDLTLELTSGSAYTFGRAFGSPLWEDTTNGGRLELPSVFLAHRESDDDVTEEGGRRGGGSALLVELMPRPDADPELTEVEMATVTMTFREPGTDEIIRQERTMLYPFNPNIIIARGFFESPVVSMVQKTFVMLNIYVGIEMACTFFHEGNGVAAIPMLERIIAAVEDYNEEIDDTDMVYNLELLRDLLALIDSLTTAEPEPSDIPENPWPAD